MPDSSVQPGPPTPPQQPRHRPQNNDGYPQNVTGTIGAGLWLVKLIANLSSDRTLTIVLCLLVGFYLWSQNEKDSRAEVRHDEMVNQGRRDRDQDREQYRQDRRADQERAAKEKIETTSLLLKHCTDTDKTNRDEQRARNEKAEVHMREASAILNKLADAVNMLTKKVGPVAEVP